MVYKLHKSETFNSSELGEEIYFFNIFYLCIDLGLDPYALVTCEGKTVRTPTLSDTPNPKWNSGALFFVRRPNKTHLVVQV